MSISKPELEEIAEEALAALLHFKDMWTSRTPDAFENAIVLVDDDVVAMGTGPDESANSKEEFGLFLKREIEQMPGGLAIDLIQPKVSVLSKDAVSISSQAVITVLGQDALPPIDMRLSTSLRKNAEGKWLISQWHTSIPWYDQAEGKSVPMDAMKARAAKLEKEVAARTEELYRANRELEIEASLERIRRVTGEMNDPSDLVEVVKQIRMEVGSLYGDSAVEVGLMQEADEDTFKFWSIFDIQDIPEDLALFGLPYPKKPDPPHPMLDRVWG